MKIIKVAAAVIVHEGQILATQRGYGEFKGMWEFPGGKVEPGESPADTVKRELKEELDVEIEVGSLLETIEYDYPEFHLSMDCFLCKIKSGNLTLKEHQDARWLTRDKLKSVEWLPADVDFIEVLIK